MRACACAGAAWPFLWGGMNRSLEIKEAFEELRFEFKFIFCHRI